ncbi:PIN domain-containing protein [Dyadobacter fanqingshengii]|uniref:PIN domain-containing protein n=1 Tax=Dyadobacter fanqingshengii TaxID=2906443 RepID=A0A9X1T9X2_9BACT|nr:PIN domain-containing protein [Dyadobacter fanqingshengii]MCF0041091.1 PIN domain-containing protein [Dyadobacter fanqingshengii]MCF2505801.1 PIN domain-containing protein [Dyadobacter fanqingshengii]USJ37182.1 PIN domain-containing protein [Dyadobacter fanqingshengii]
MRIFFDTNVLLDHALMRKTGQPVEISYLIFWALKNDVSIVISAGSIYTFTYVLHKQGVRGERLKLQIEQYLTMFHICKTDKKVFTDGLDSTFKDLEDSYQYMNAIKDECNYLITSNISDFKPFAKDAIQIFSPRNFVTNVTGAKEGIDF